MQEFWNAFLETAYRMAREVLEHFETSKFLVQHSSVLVALPMEDVLHRLGRSPDEEEVIDTIRALFMEKGSEGKVVLNYKDARIEIKRSLSGVGGIRISKYMPPIKWVYVYLPVTYYEKARRRLLSEG